MLCATGSLLKHRSDGLEIDWEQGGCSSSPGTPSDTANFIAFAQALRSAVGSKPQLSAAVPVQGLPQKISLAKAVGSKALNFLNVMNCACGLTRPKLTRQMTMPLRAGRQSSAPTLLYTSALRRTATRVAPTLRCPRTKRWAWMRRTSLWGCVDPVRDQTHANSTPSYGYRWG